MLLEELAHVGFAKRDGNTVDASFKAGAKVICLKSILCTKLASAFGDCRSVSTTLLSVNPSLRRTFELEVVNQRLLLVLGKTQLLNRSSSRRSIWRINEFRSLAFQSGHGGGLFGLKIGLESTRESIE